MRRVIFALLLAAAPATAAPDVDRLLSGVPDGRPEHCIQQRFIRGQTIVNQSTIVFERGYGRYYRSDVGPNCAALRPDRTIITREIAVGICDGDPFQVIDTESRTGYGTCTFGPFVPYKRPSAK